MIRDVKRTRQAPLRYNSPPNWPPPPSADWTPPPGWSAPAEWGPAPAGWQFWTPVDAADARRATNKKTLKVFGIIVAALIGVTIIGSAFGSSDETPSASAGEAPGATTPTQAPPATEAAPAGPQLTSQQRHAAESARQYLSLQGFSRLGLIAQLSSAAGEGFSRRDATIAVDSLRVDWKAQAVRSARAYLDIQSFSCRGLIEQLSSSAGDRYTRAQAEYGARQTDAC